MSCTGQVVWILGLGYLGRCLAAQCQAAGARVFTIDVSAAAGADMCADASHPDSIADAVACANKVQLHSTYFLKGGANDQ